MINWPSQVKKKAFENTQNVKIQIILCMHKVSSRPLLCMDAQADLGLHCLHMPQDTFSHGMAQIQLVP